MTNYGGCVARQSILDVTSSIPRPLLMQMQPMRAGVWCVDTRTRRAPRRTREEPTHRAHQAPRLAASHSWLRRRGAVASVATAAARAAPSRWSNLAASRTPPGSNSGRTLWVAAIATPGRTADAAARRAGESAVSPRRWVCIAEGAGPAPARAARSGSASAPPTAEARGGGWRWKRGPSGKRTAGGHTRPAGAVASGAPSSNCGVGRAGVGNCETAGWAGVGGRRGIEGRWHRDTLVGFVSVRVGGVVVVAGPTLAAPSSSSAASAAARWQELPSSPLYHQGKAMPGRLARVLAPCWHGQRTVRGRRR
eukprot:scaffold28353_cov129-Isochrysis_galbana.AAC.3